MSSGYDALNGGVNGPTASRNKKQGKKFGKNLNQLTKPPTAPPVPSVISPVLSVSVNSKGPSHGLLLLSKKSQSSSGGLLSTPAGVIVGKDSFAPEISSKQITLDAGSMSVQGDVLYDGQRDNDEKANILATAWGIKGEKQALQNKKQLSLVEESTEIINLQSTTHLPTKPETKEKNPVSGVDDKISSLVLAPRRFATKKRDSVNAVNESLSTFDKVADKKLQGSLQKGITSKKEHHRQIASKIVEKSLGQQNSKGRARILLPKENDHMELIESDQKKEKEKQSYHPQQKQTQHQSKQQKEQHCSDGPPTSIVIEKDTTSFKKSSPPNASHAPFKIYSRKDISQPNTILEPLGKLKEVATHSDLTVQKQKDFDAKRACDAQRTYSSLMGGKVKRLEHGGIGDGSIKSGRSDESSAAKESKSSLKKPIASTNDKSDESLLPNFRMVNLNTFEDREKRGGRGAINAASPRMLFDPASGSLVAAPSYDPPQPPQQPQHAISKVSVKKTKQPQLQQKSYLNVGKPLENSPKLLIRRPDGDGVFLDNDNFTRGKQGQVLRQQFDIESKKCSPVTKLKTKLPRTRGALFRMDHNGNYVSVDGCEADNGYGQHSVPGGRVKNSNLYVKLLDLKVHEKEQDSLERCIGKDNQSSYKVPVFSEFRSDPSFIKQQNDFEAQQQRILEEAWSSLVEAEPSYNDDQINEGHLLQSDEAIKDLDDECAAALAVGLGFHEVNPNDLEKFTLNDVSPESSSLNRFKSVGGGSRLLELNTWSTSISTTNRIPVSDAFGFADWNFTPNTVDIDSRVENIPGSTPDISKSVNPFINLSAWSSSGFGGFTFGVGNPDATKGAD